MKTMHYCFNCGAELGMVDGKQRQRDMDTCGEQDCEREARDELAAEREQAHEQLDYERGWR